MDTKKNPGACDWCGLMMAIQPCAHCERWYCHCCLSPRGYCPNCVHEEFPDMPYVGYYDDEDRDGTVHQLSLDFAARREERTIAERFEAWLREHPDRYEAFKTLARRLKDRGARRISSKALFEFMRMDALLSGKDANGYKVNNIYSSRAARRLIEEYPEFADLFELRELKAE